MLVPRRDLVRILTRDGKAGEWLATVDGMSKNRALLLVVLAALLVVLSKKVKDV